jgi:hypothetical protein
VTFAAVRAGQKAADVGALAVEVFRNRKRRAATARNEEHPRKLLLLYACFSLRSHCL